MKLLEGALCAVFGLCWGMLVGASIYAFEPPRPIRKCWPDPPLPKFVGSFAGAAYDLPRPIAPEKNPPKPRPYVISPSKVDAIRGEVDALKAEVSKLRQQIEILQLHVFKPEAEQPLQPAFRVILPRHRFGMTPSQIADRTVVIGRCDALNRGTTQ